MANTSKHTNKYHNMKQKNNTNTNARKASPKQKNRPPRQYYNKRNDITGKIFEFKMPAGMYDTLAAQCKKERRGDIQEYLCDFVNSQFRLMGTCVKVIRG